MSKANNQRQEESKKKCVTCNRIGFYDAKRDKWICEFCDNSPEKIMEKMLVMSKDGYNYSIGWEKYGISFPQVAQLLEHQSKELQRKDEALEWMTKQERLTFAECSLAEEWVDRAREALQPSSLDDE